MSTKPDITFAKFSAPETGLAVVLADDEGKVGAAGLAADPGGILRRAFDASEFKGKAGSVADILAPAGSKLDRLAAVGVGKSGALDEQAWLKVGGAIAALIRKARKVAVIADVPGADVDAAAIATLATGILLRSYAFDRYKTRKDDGAEQPAKVDIVIHCANPAAARKAFAEAAGVVEGVLIARDLVNEPANVLGPVEMAAKAAELESLGVRVEILTEKDMRKLGMAALLGVSQGSERPARLVVMQWQGGKAKAEPLAFVGKGVVFDSGGISIKGAAGMEDMKGDMAGAAAVIGLMHALASRKAKANVVGIIGCVENMLDGKAQRPGDIVTSMSGQTIEVINTDAEGRLVLADALWYCNDRFKPRFMIDLATLTGAVIVALGSHHAGLFSNDDALAANLLSAGISTQERLWRLPLGPEYDKMIDTKNADMKNTGGRHGGSITAAQFLQRFVKETPWAHLDIAGTAIGSPSTEINQSWASGFGVRLLDRLVRDHYED
jgi:leucyl aminopeptidase